MDLSKINRRYNPASGISGARNIYMIGIKGVGMTMLAQYLAENGFKISGSDVKDKYMTDEVLKSSGIKVMEKFSPENIPKEADLIIYSTAYNAETNIEVAEALKSKIKILTYAEALGKIFNQKYGIAVVGSHGKTTTTAWLGYVLEKAGLGPNVMVGARVSQFKGTSLVGPSDYLVAEIDEYQNKLKYFNPKMVLLNNIDYDHPDFFPSQDDYRQVFVEFIKKIPSSGFLIANNDDKITKSISQVNCRGKVITYGLEEVADYIAYDIKEVGNKQFFKVKFGVDDDENNEELKKKTLGVRGHQVSREGDLLGDFSISLIGKHNISNALAVIAACVELEVKLVDIRKYLEEFKGTARRMEILGEFRGATIIDDYAHHPTEIKAVLAGVRQLYPKNNLRVIFHPHTYTRTKAMLNDFSKSFNLADEVIVLDIYGSAREEQGGVHSKDLVKKIVETHGNASVQYIPTLKECEKYLRENIERDDIVLLMGAGDVFRIGENLVKS